MQLYIAADSTLSRWADIGRCAVTNRAEVGEVLSEAIEALGEVEKNRVV